MAISTYISQALHALPKTELRLHIEGHAGTRTRPTAGRS